MIVRSLIFCAVTVIIYRVYTSCVNMGLYKHVFNHRPGECHVVPGYNDGAEDMVQMPDGTVIVSHGLNLFNIGNVEDYRSVKGEFSVFNFSKPEAGSKKLQIVRTSGLELDLDGMKPHGLGHYNDGQNDYIFVVNHSPRGDVVEKFKYSASKRTLEHVHTYEHALFAGHNDVLPIGPDAFYLTIMTRFRGVFLVTVELLIGAPTGRTILYEGCQARSVADGLFMNGINMSPDGRSVYIAQVAPSVGFGIYERLTSNELKLISYQHIGNSVDNIEVLPNGDLVLGTQVSGLKASEKLKNRYGAKAPSQVLYVKMADKGRSVKAITSLLGDDGTMVDGASVATVYKDNLLIGTFHEKMIYCKLTVPFKG